MPGVADLLSGRLGRGLALPRFWREAAQENPLCSFVSAAAPAGPHDVVTRGGDYFRMFRLRGLAFEGAEPAWIAEHHHALAGLIRNLIPGRSAVYLHRVHRFVQDRLDTHGTQGFARRFAERYAARLAERPLLMTDLYLTILVRPERSESTAIARRRRTEGTTRAQRGSPGDSLIASDLLRQRTLKELDDLATLAVRSLRDFDPMPLGVRESGGEVFWEPGELLSLLINGRSRPVRLPRGPVWQTLPDARLTFSGDTLEMRHLDQRRYAKLLSLKRLQRHVEPGTLGALLYEPCEFIETQSWASSPKRQAQAALTLQRDQLTASEDAALSEIEELDAARDLVAAGELSMGEYAYTLAVFGDSIEQASRAASRCAAALIETTDLELASVDLVADAAWFSQQPGNLQWRPRKAMISNRAFAALGCAHNFAHGQRDGGPWGRCIALLRACSGAPYYFHFHANPDGGDATGQRLPGNTLIVGTTGSGKTTLLGALLTLSARLDPRPRIVSFSLDRDTEILIRALGGRFNAIRYGVPTGLNPFLRPPTPENQGFWVRLLARCIHNPRMPLLPSDEEDLARAVAAVALLPQELRSMSTVRQNLPRTGPNSLHDRLARWCHDGELGWVFDAGTAVDGDPAAAPFADPTVPAWGFDYTELLDAPDVRAPLLQLLLQTMEEQLDGHPLIYHVAEAWKALSDPIFAPFLRQQQKTIRKKNGLGIFDTQQVEDLLGSEVGRVMIEQSPTKLLLTNPDATRRDYVEGLGLTDAEFDLFRDVTAGHRRRFVVKQASDFVPCELDLGGMDEELAVLGATPDNLRRLDAARQEACTRFGPAAGDDPHVWLPLYLDRVTASRAVNRTPETESARELQRADPHFALRFPARGADSHV